MQDGSPSRAPDRVTAVVSGDRGSGAPEPKGSAPGAKTVRLVTSNETIRRMVRVYCEDVVDVAADHAPDGGELSIRLRVVEDEGAPISETPEERWTGLPQLLTVRYGSLLEATVDVERAVIDGWARRHIVHERPDITGRLLIEAPLAAVRARHGWQVVHAATVVGPEGAVVIRGSSDGGKSTLAAAAWKAGLGILGDESVLVSGPSHRELVASVREVLIRPSMAEALSLEGDPVTTAEGEVKVRLPLPPIPVGDRSSVHAATVLLGEKDRPGGARAVPLGPGELEAGFAAGEIPQERWYGSPERLARDWARRPAYRLDGTVDLDGAVAVLGRLCRGEAT